MNENTEDVRKGLDKAQHENALITLRLKRGLLREAEDAVEAARHELNYAVVNARAVGVTVAKVVEAVGWKQPKSVYDAVKAYNDKEAARDGR